MNATIRRLSIPFLALSVLLLAALPTDARQGADLGNDGVDMDCADFGELNAARAYFATDGGSAARNVDNLDADRDGLACEPGDDGDATEPPADTDGDGLTDAEEVQHGTDITRADTDGDGTDDRDEVAAGTDPTDPASAPGGGPGPGDLLVQVFTCPPGYAGTDYVGQCAATGGVAFSTGPAGGEVTDTATTGANGAAFFEDLGVGAFVVAADLPGDALDRVEIFCAAPGDTEPRAITRNGLTAITADVRAGEQLTCSFYVVPADAGQPSAAPSAVPSAKPSASAKPSTRPTTLPNTGTGGPASTGVDDLAPDLMLAAGALIALIGTATAVRRRV